MLQKIAMDKQPKSKSSGYCAPSTGVFKHIPSAWVPYAELMRIDRPAGYYAFYWHYAIGLAFAACVISPTISPITLATVAVYLAIWVFVFRGATCTWNDNLDQEFDRKVERCKYRPIARNAVSTFQGHVFTLIQVAICLVMIMPFPPAVIAYAVVMMALLTFYPLGKRITDFPQVILGFSFGMPVFMCLAAFGGNLLSSQAMLNDRDMTQVARGAGCIYGACVLWTIIFDTIYAHQDIQDDIKAGVKSLAVRLGDNTKYGCGALGTIQVGLLIRAGLLCNLSTVYFVLACGGTACSLLSMLVLVNLKVPAECAWWFGPGSRLVGASMVSGLLGHYAGQFVC